MNEIERNRIYAQAEYDNTFLVESKLAAKAYAQYFAWKKLQYEKECIEHKIIYEHLKEQIAEAYVEWKKQNV